MVKSSFLYRKYELYNYGFIGIGKVIIKETNFRKEKNELMAGKTTVALTLEQLKEIIKTMRSGGTGFRANDRIATCLVLEANLGIRIGDILNLRLCDIVEDGDIFRLDIIEEKTGKKRTFPVKVETLNFLKLYCLENAIKSDEIIFPVSERQVQKYLQKVTDYLGIKDVGTHSFRKFFATEIYEQNDHDFELVRQLLQHSSITTTQRYIKRSRKQITVAIMKHGIYV